jgi:hypothetical protein
LLLKLRLWQRRAFRSLRGHMPALNLVVQMSNDAVRSSATASEVGHLP